MAISFNQALGIHEQALQVRTTRARLIANNLANADTPNYKARDIDFREILNRAGRDDFVELALTRTRPSHQDASSEGLSVAGENAELFYRTPSQPSIDGNTVDEHIEHSEYMQNVLAFQTSFTLLNKKFMGLKSAIRGE